MHHRHAHNLRVRLTACCMLSHTTCTMYWACCCCTVSGGSQLTISSFLRGPSIHQRGDCVSAVRYRMLLLRQLSLHATGWCVSTVEKHLQGQPALAGRSHDPLQLLRPSVVSLSRASTCGSIDTAYGTSQRPGSDPCRARGARMLQVVPDSTTVPALLQGDGSARPCAYHALRALPGGRGQQLIVPSTEGRVSYMTRMSYQYQCW